MNNNQNTAVSLDEPTDEKIEIVKKEKKSFPQKITSFIAVILCLVLLPILLANLIIIVKGSLVPDEVPTILGYAPMAVMTDSMNTGDTNDIKSGDMVVTKKMPVNQLMVGDIIMFKNNNTAVIHRIVAYNNNSKTFITKGDANNTEDLEPVQMKNVIGKYIGRVPKVGEFILFSKTPLGMLICIGLPIILLLGYDFVTKNRFVMKKK